MDLHGHNVQYICTILQLRVVCTHVLTSESTRGHYKNPGITDTRVTAVANHQTRWAGKPPNNHPSQQRLSRLHCTIVVQSSDWVVCSAPSWFRAATESSSVHHRGSKSRFTYWINRTKMEYVTSRCLGGLLLLCQQCKSGLLHQQCKSRLLCQQCYSGVLCQQWNSDYSASSVIQDYPASSVTREYSAISVTQGLFCQQCNSGLLCQQRNSGVLCQQCNSGVVCQQCNSGVLCQQCNSGLLCQQR